VPSAEWESFQATINLATAIQADQDAAAQSEDEDEEILEQKLAEDDLEQAYVMAVGQEWLQALYSAS
jgi:hypothetical protein